MKSSSTVSFSRGKPTRFFSLKTLPLSTSRSCSSGSLSLARNIVSCVASDESAQKSFMSVIPGLYGAGPTSPGECPTSLNTKSEYRTRVLAPRADVSTVDGTSSKNESDTMIDSVCSSPTDGHGNTWTSSARREYRTMFNSSIVSIYMPR